MSRFTNRDVDSRMAPVLVDGRSLTVTQLAEIAAMIGDGTLESSCAAEVK